METTAYNVVVRSIGGLELLQLHAAEPYTVQEILVLACTSHGFEPSTMALKWEDGRPAINPHTIVKDHKCTLVLESVKGQACLPAPGVEQPAPIEDGVCQALGLSVGKTHRVRFVTSEPAQNGYMDIEDGAITIVKVGEEVFEPLYEDEGCTTFGSSLSYRLVLGKTSLDDAKTLTASFWPMKNPDDTVSVRFFLKL